VYRESPGAGTGLGSNFVRARKIFELGVVGL
jgi:hypothetical protein